MKIACGLAAPALHIKISLPFAGSDLGRLRFEEK